MLLYECLPDLVFICLYVSVILLTTYDQPRILNYTNGFVPWITNCYNIAKLKYLNSVQLFKVTGAGLLTKFYWEKEYAHIGPFTS